MNNKYSREIKIILLGDSGVGKTSIIHLYINKEFNDTMPATVGLEFQQKIININGETIKISIYDTSGQEKYRTVTQNYYRNIDGVILVYDITRIQTFLNLEYYWIEQLRENTEKSLNMILIDNKLDLKKECDINKIVTTELGKKMAQNFFTLFIETSAKTGDGLQNVFQELIERINSDYQFSEQISKVELKRKDDIDVENEGFCC